MGGLIAVTRTAAINDDMTGFTWGMCAIDGTRSVMSVASGDSVTAHTIANVRKIA